MSKILKNWYTLPQPSKIHHLLITLIIIFVAFPSLDLLYVSRLFFRKVHDFHVLHGGLCYHGCLDYHGYPDFFVIDVFSNLN